MKKKFATMLLPLLLLAGCGTETKPSLPSENTSNSETTTEEKPAELNELQKIFQKLAENNFTAEYTLTYASLDHDVQQKAYYTNYAIETDGYAGFNSVAQGQDCIFPYTRTSDGSIESKTPIVNLYNGMRYQTLDDYRPTFMHINLDALPSEKDSDGFYPYVYGKDVANDETIARITSLSTSGSALPESIRFKVIGESLIFEVINLTYPLEDGTFKEDKIVGSFYDLGTTEIADVKAFLDNGGKEKDFLDDRFVFFLLPYFVSTNFSVRVDLNGIHSENISMKNYVHKYTRNAEIQYVPGKEAQGIGNVEFSGAVVNYKLDANGHVQFQGNNMSSPGELMTDLWYESIGTSFLTITPNNLNGYIRQEGDVTEYHILDTQFIQAITNLATVGYNESFYLDEVILTIDDFDEHVFTVEMNYYNKQTKEDLGTAFATFYDKDKTTIAPIADLFYEGDTPSENNKEDFAKALQLFQTNNYSEYVMSGDQMNVNTYVYNPNYTYYYNEYLGYSSGYGFIKDHDGKIRKGVVTEEQTIQFDQTVYSYQLPGVGKRMESEDNLGYLSSPVIYTADGRVDEEKTQSVRSALYDIDNYSIYEESGFSMWQNKSPEVMAFVKSYFASIFGTAYTPYAVGFKASLKEEEALDNYKNKMTFYIFVYDENGNTFSTSMNYFNLGGSNVTIIDDYLNS